MKSFELTVTGDVQGVGYRRTVVKIARNLDVAGFVKNQPDGSVKILAQGDEEEKLEKFVQAIAINKPPIKVKGIQRKENVRPVQGYKTSFVIKTGSLAEELQEGLCAGEEQLSLLGQRFEDFRHDFRDYRNGFEDFRHDFGDYRKEFTDYRQEFKGFATRTDANFSALSDKYGEISAKLTQVLETLERESTETRRELTRAVDRLSDLVDAYILQQKVPSTKQKEGEEAFGKQ